jgi:hypothetical protein
MNMQLVVRLCYVFKDLLAITGGSDFVHRPDSK